MDARNRKLRMGMVGGGPGAFIGGVHRMAAALDQQVELVAGSFSRDYEKTKEAGKKLFLDESRLYASYREMAEKEAALPDEQKIDFVAVVTPNKSHFDIAKTFLEAGFHVVCDKPMTYTLDEAKELVKIVEDSGLVFALTHNYTGHPLMRHARELFQQGELGDVWKVMVEYLQEFLMAPLEKEGQKQASWRIDPAQSGIAGTIGDIGTHCFNLVEYVTGDEIVEICSDKTTFLPDRELEEDANILLRFKSGGKGTLCCSQVAVGEENGLRLLVYGSKGGVRWNQEEPNYMDLLLQGEPPRKLGRAQGYLGDGAAAASSRTPAGHPEGYLEAFATIYVGAVEAIRRHIEGNAMKTEEYDFPTVYDGLRGMQFIYAAVESAEKGAVWVPIER
ncbi:MAG: Gfo/Idh/MocA family protein [Candidatus Sumerlaeota bacterium]